MGKICSGCKSFLFGTFITMTKNGVNYDYHDICFKKLYPKIWARLDKKYKKRTEFDGHCKSCISWIKEFVKDFGVMIPCKCHCKKCINAIRKETV